MKYNLHEIEFNIGRTVEQLVDLSPIENLVNTGSLLSFFSLIKFELFSKQGLQDWTA